MPAGGMGPEHIAAIRQWREAELRPPPGGGDGELNLEYKRAQLGLARERVRRLRQYRKLSKGLYVHRKRLDATLGGFATLLTKALDELMPRLPSALAGYTGPQIEKVLQCEFDAMRRRLADRREYPTRPVAELVRELGPRLSNSDT